MDTTQSATCDTCGPLIRARVIVSLPSGNSLSYCRHHAEVYRAKLEDMGAFLFLLGEP